MATVTMLKTLITKLSQYLELTKNGMDEADFTQTKFEALRAISKQLEKVDKFLSWMDAVAICQLIQDGPIMPSDKKAIGSHRTH